MRRGGGDKHDLLSRKKPSDTVDDGHILKRPAGTGFGLDPLQLALGHARKMFQHHGCDAVVAAQPPHRSDKQRNAANGLRLKRAAFRADIEILALNPHRHSQPPVTGGKNATSSPAATGVSRSP